MNRQICYLNTDLDVTSAEDLNDLASALESTGVFPLHVTRHQSGIWTATFETDRQHQDPETNILAMLDSIESLAEAQRCAWQTCTRREFNIGYDCGDEPWAFNQGLSSHLLGRLAAVGSSLRWTLYPDCTDRTLTS